MQDIIIQADQAGRRFGHRAALNGIDLKVHAGSMLGLVGPNGSGKTTLLKLMAGFIKPTSGKVRLFGHDPYIHRTAVMGRARFTFAPPPIYGSLTAWEHLKYLSAAGVRQSERISSQEIMAGIRKVGLGHRAHDKTRTYSFGMKQRLGLAQALLPMPELLVFDEPNDGLDPIAVAELRAILKRLQREYHLTIVLSSHLLNEVEKLVDILLVLNDGQPVFCGPPAQLLDDERRIEIRIEGNLAAGVDVFRRCGFTPEVGGDSRLLLPAGSIRLPEAARLLSRQGLKLIEFHEKSSGLTEAYIRRLHKISAPPQDHP